MAKKGRQGEGGGQPKKLLTEEQIIQVEALAAYLSKEQIAAYMGIAKATWYEIEKRQPDVLERYEKGKAKVVGAVAQSLIQKARDGDNTAAIFYLKTQAGWKEKQELDITSGGKEIRNNFIIQPVTTKTDNG